MLLYIAIILVIFLIWQYIVNEHFGDRPMNIYDWILFREQIDYRRRRYCHNSPPVAELLWT